MSERPPHRRPATFKLDDPGVVVMDPDDASRPPRGTVHVTPEADPALLPVPIEAPLVPARRGFRWGTLFWTALGGLVLLGAGLGVANLIEDLFARSESLGFLGLALCRRRRAGAGRRDRARGVRAGAARHHREAASARRRSARQRRSRARAAPSCGDLLKLAHQNPQLARARAALQGHADDIIDGADMIRLAERELMTPLDQEARRLVSSAAQRVSIVTAVSPRALIDVLFVFVGVAAADPATGAALWRPARHARHDPADAPRHRAISPSPAAWRRATA